MRSDGTLPPKWKPDMRLAALKPQHAQWLLDAFQSVEGRKKLIKRGWRKTGIKDAIKHLF